MEITLKLRAHTEGGRCLNQCPFLRVTIPGGYHCALFGPLTMETEYGPEAATLAGGGYPLRNFHCIEQEKE